MKRNELDNVNKLILSFNESPIWAKNLLSLLWCWKANKKKTVIHWWLVYFSIDVKNSWCVSDVGIKFSLGLFYDRQSKITLAYLFLSPDATRIYSQPTCIRFIQKIENRQKRSHSWRNHTQKNITSPTTSRYPNNSPLRTEPKTWRGGPLNPTSSGSWSSRFSPISSVYS